MNWTVCNVLIGSLAVLRVLTVVGLIWLWPSGQDLSSKVNKTYDTQSLTYESATITDIKDGCDTQQVGQAKCLTATVTINTGEGASKSVEITLPDPRAQSGLKPGDVMEVNRTNAGDEPIWSYLSANRSPVLGVLATLFVVVVLAVTRRKGLPALLGFGFVGAVLVGFMLSALITGKPGTTVALVGGTVVMFVVLYVAHSVSIQTPAALVDTLSGLAITVGLGALSAEFAQLSGLVDENEHDLVQLLPGMDFRELLMMSITVGGPDVLNDVIITQSSAVWELRAAAPKMSRGKPFAAGMQIGRDHIASTIHTIVFAYVGGSMVVLLLLCLIDRPATALLNAEMLAGETVCTLGSAIGLVLSVPIMIGIAALTVASPEPEPWGRHAMDVDVE